MRSNSLFRFGSSMQRVSCCIKSPFEDSVRTLSTTAGKRHYERKLIRVPINILFGVVSDVDKYHEFVPWCRKSKVISKQNNHMTAELEVGFNMFNERYVSKVEVSQPTLVAAVSTETALFNYLKTEWKFTPASDPESTWVTFQVNFQFKSSLYNEISQLFMQEVIAKMVMAFENRCHQQIRKLKAHC
jgi:ribosome-associated toxin RatA of RatAB toxin-antitoxin module